MNSKQRRKERRRWLREHKEEIEKVIVWINQLDKFIPLSDVPNSDNIIELVPEYAEQIEAFGMIFARSKKYWKEFLIEKGISPERFTTSSL